MWIFSKRKATRGLLVAFSGRWCDRVWLWNSRALVSMIILFAGRSMRGLIFAPAASGRWDLRLKIVSARAASGGSAGLNVKRDLRFSRFSAWGFVCAGRVGGGEIVRIRVWNRSPGCALWTFLSVLARVLSVLARVLSVLARVLPVLARVLPVLTRVLPVLTRVLPVLTRVLPMNLGESARIGEFGERHHRVFRHSRRRRRHGKNKDILE